MLFDERPKARREDLFDRVKEVSNVIDAIDTVSYTHLTLPTIYSV